MRASSSDILSATAHYSGRKDHPVKAEQFQVQRSLSQLPQQTPKVANILPDMDEKTRAQKKFTLVLDLDETLIHFESSQKKFKLRPGCLMFLKEMSTLFEIVIFTAASQDYADFILNIVEKRLKEGGGSDGDNQQAPILPSNDSNKYIDHRLYRHHCQLDDGVFVKDLSLLGRDLSKTIIVDNIRDNFERQPENGIEIMTWIGNPEDRELHKLGQFFKSIAKS